MLLEVGRVRVTKDLHFSKKGLPGVPGLLNQAASWAGLSTLGTWRSWMLSKQAAKFQASLGNSQAHPLLPTSCSFCAPDSTMLYLAVLPASTHSLTPALPLQKMQAPEY